MTGRVGARWRRPATAAGETGPEDDEGSEAYLQAICRTTTALFKVPFASVNVLGDTHLRHLACEGFVPTGVPRDIAFCSWTARMAGGEPLVVHDTQADPRFADHPMVVGAPHLRFYAGVALKLGSTRREATLCIADLAPRPDFGAADIAQLRDIAAFIEAHLDLLAAHQRRRREAETLRITLEGMDQGLIVIDPDDRIRVSNRRAAELLGVPDHLLCEGASFDAVRRHQVAHGEFAGLPDRLRQWLESGEQALHVPLYERECANGTVVEVRSLPMDDGGTIKTITDVTAQRAAESAVRDGERRYRLIADNVNDVIVLNDLDFTRRYVSPSVSTVLGYAPAELVGGHPADLVHPDDMEAYARAADGVRCGRADRALTTQRYRHRDGRWVWLEVSFRLTLDPRTNSPDGFVSIMRDVSTRKRAEEGLRCSEARQRAIVDALPQMMVIASAETGDALYSNKPFETYFGSAASSFEARVALVHPDDLDRYHDLLGHARSRQGRYEGELRLRRRDGVYRWHKMVMVPIVEDGVTQAVVDTALDVDDIVSARRELARTSELLQVAQAAAGAGVWEWDPACDRLSLSPASARMHGLPVGDGDAPTVVSLAAWKARVDPADMAVVRNAVKRGRDEGLANVAEFRTLTPELPEGRRWVQSFSHPVHEEGKVRFVGLHLDITERREAEEALRASEAQVRMREERLALALESGDDGLFDTDVERGTHWVSQRWVERLGYGAEAAQKPLAFWLQAIHPDDLGPFVAAMEAHKRGGTPVVENEHRLRCADGTYIWVMSRARVMARDAHGDPSRIVGTLIDVSRRKEAEMRVRHMAEHDALTELPNRHVFNRWIADAADRSRIEPNRHAVLICDLDRFKAINDTLGHLIGDRILCAAADRIRSAVRPQDVVARLGGDEFAVLLSEVGDREAVAIACQRIIAALGEPLQVGHLCVDIGISVGAVVMAADGAGAEEVFKRADIALYEAKAGGRNTYRLFETETHARVTSRSLLALDLHEGVRRGDFFLAYQPIIDVITGAVSSLEALMRWQHPDRGLISPGEFIPVAEETGAILPMGAWALEEACHEAIVWPDSVRVAVNVSATQFRRDLEGSVRKALDTSGLPPDRLMLEVTESALMHDPEQIRETLCRLKDMGVRIALDDFGTGYSSLSYLRRFPFDKLKIDRAFVRDIANPDAAAIIRAVVGIGERLGMSIVAEGVETEEQLDLVRREGCRHVQGFLFSRPLPASKARAFLARRSPHGR